MAIPHADQLIERAKKGEKLSPKERRHCVHYLIGHNTMTNEEMGSLFQVTERQIRFDRKHIREERAKAIREEDVGLVVADIALHFERQVRDIEKGKAKAQVGSRTYLEYCKAAHELQLKTIQALQNLGYYPKNLGTITTQNFEFKASVDKMTGAIVTMPMSQFKENEQGEIIDVEVEETQPKQIEGAKAV